MVKLRENEVVANEVDSENNQVLELAVNEETFKTRFIRVLPDDEAVVILQMFIEHDSDTDFVQLCQKVLNSIGQN